MLFPVDGDLPVADQVREGVRRVREERLKGTTYDHVWSVIVSRDAIDLSEIEAAIEAARRQRAQVAFQVPSFEHWAEKHRACGLVHLEDAPHADRCVDPGEDGMHRILAVMRAA